MGKKNPKRNPRKSLYGDEEGPIKLTSDNAVILMDQNLKSGDWILVAGDLNACLESGWTKKLDDASKDGYMGSFKNKGGTIPFMMLKKGEDLRNLLELTGEKFERLVAIEFDSNAEFRCAYYDEKMPLERVVKVVMSSFVEQVDGVK